MVGEFGTLGAALKGSITRLRRVGAASALPTLRRLDTIISHVLLERLQHRPIIGEWRALLDYLQVTMQHRTSEQVRVLHLNTRNILIKDELLADGTIDHAAVHVREMMTRCLELGTAAVILVHNHPSGDPTPSGADITLTQQVVDAAKHFDIRVHDHLIIGTDGHASMRAKGLM
jgi:DNA repair protein RadC